MRDFFHTETNTVILSRYTLRTAAKLNVMQYINTCNTIPYMQCHISNLPKLVVMSKCRPNGGKWWLLRYSHPALTAMDNEHNFFNINLLFMSFILLYILRIQYVSVKDTATCTNNTSQKLAGNMYKPSSSTITFRWRTF